MKGTIRCVLFGHRFMGVERVRTNPTETPIDPFMRGYVDLKVRLDYCNRCGLCKEELGIITKE